jgi:uncharacterized membrane protein YedE/YeeE
VITTALLLLLSAGLAGMVGFAASHSGICAVRAVDDLLEGRGWDLFLGFLRCSLWVAAVTLPLIWFVLPEPRLAFSYPLAWPVVAGGFLFGVGAALNGGCAFSTVSDLGAGDLGAPFAFLGLGFGVLLHDLGTVPLLSMPAPSPNALAEPQPWSVVLLLILLAWALREAALLLRPGPRRVRRAMACIGLAGGVLYALHGPWVYTAGLAGAAAWAASVGPAPTPLIPALFAALLAGAVLGARARGATRLRRPTAAGAARRLTGGAMMGAGAGLVPGGNDVLVLHALPGLAVHVPLAYGALVAGVAVTLAVLRRRPRR